jgi:hypothetical protein
MFMTRRGFFGLIAAAFAGSRAAKFPVAPWGGSGEPFAGMNFEFHADALSMDTLSERYIMPAVIACAEKIVSNEAFRFKRFKCS